MLIILRILHDIDLGLYKGEMSYSYKVNSLNMLSNDIISTLLVSLHVVAFMAGRPTKFSLDITPEERSRLEKIASSRSCQLRHQQRAKIILLRAEGLNYSEIESAVGVSTPTVAKIIKRASIYGVTAAMDDLERPGRPDTITREAKAWVISLACTIPDQLNDGPKTQNWTLLSLSDYIQRNCMANGHPTLANIQRSTVWKILNSKNIKPHRIKYYLERKDDEFEVKAKSVILLYKRVEWILQFTRDLHGEGISASDLSGEVFISYDEKPGIQAISNIAPDLAPTEKYSSVARDYEYRRLGTVSLLAGIDLFTGKVHGFVRDKHKSEEFIEFLELVNNRYDENLTINIILDNHSVHRSKKTMEYLATVRPGRFKFVFTPKHASWLNIIESFFSKLTRQALKNLRVPTKQDLVQRIESWIDKTNEEPVVFRWKWGLEDIESALNSSK